MSYSDWEHFTSNVPPLTFSINVISPIVSLGSGRIGAGTLAGGSTMSNINVTVGSGRVQGVVRGKLRTLFRHDNFTFGGEYGLLCLQSSQNVASLGGDFYQAKVIKNDGRLHLSKGIGTNLFGAGSLASVAFAPGNNTVWSLELEWVADLTELGGTALFVRRGFATDFSDLTTVIAYLDVVSPHLISVSEGISVMENAIGGPFFVDFDSTSLFIP